MKELLDRFRDELRKGSLTESFQAARALVSQEGKDEPAARNIGAVLLGLYNELDVKPVFLFLNSCAAEIDKSHCERIHEVLKPALEMTAKWITTLQAINIERLVRDLQEAVREKKDENAVAVMNKMLAKARDTESLVSMCQYVGTVLGTLDNDQPMVLHVLDMIRKHPAKYRFSGESLKMIEEARQQRFETLGKIRLEAKGLEWNRTLIRTVVDMKTHLPGRMTLEAADQSEFREFVDYLVALIRAPVEKNRSDLLIEVTLLLVELCPKELSVAGERAGIEKRLFLTLTPMQQGFVRAALKELQHREKIVSLFLSLARSVEETAYLPYVVEVMGAIGASRFLPYLLECVRNKKSRHCEDETVEALGNLGLLQAADALVDLLKKPLDHRVIDPPKQRKAVRIISSIGLVISNPVTPREERNRIIGNVIDLVPDTELRLKMAVAKDCLRHNTAHIDPRYIDWAATALVKGMWLKDDAPSFAAGEERQRTQLGFREEIVDILVGIGEPGLPTILREADKFVSRYSGAFIALSDVFNKIGDPGCIPLLKKMLLSSFSIEEEEISKYKKEYYWDSADGVRKEINRDKIISSLIYTVNHIGGTEADEMLSNILAQIREGRLPQPGKETAQFLIDAQMRISRQSGDSTSVSSETAARRSLSPEEKKEAERSLSSLKKGYGFNAEKRRRFKIAALNRLAQFRYTPALDLIVAHLTDKDVMVVAAAQAALGAFGEYGVSQTTYEALFYSLTHTLEKGGRDLRSAIVNQLRDMKPHLEPLRTKLINFLKVCENRKVCEILSVLVEEIQQKEEQREEALPSNEEEKTESEPEIHVDIVEKRRQYMLARQEWVKGGKKGPPPEIP